MPDPASIDSLLRYAVHVDRLAVSTLRDMLDDIDAALRTIAAKIDAVAPDGSPLTLARLTAMRAELEAVRQTLAAALAGRVRDSLAAVLDTAGTPLAETIRTAILDSTMGRSGDPLGRMSIGFIAVPVEHLARIADQPYDGMSWTRWGERLADDVMARVVSELRQAAGLGEGIPDRTKRLERVAALARTSADRLARTAHIATANRVWRAFAEANSNLIVGFRYVATLDGRTSGICRALDGRTFRLDDPDIPFPPRHPNCRSLLLPITSFDEPTGGERPFVRSTTSLSEMTPEYRRLAKERIGEHWRSMSEPERRAEIRIERLRWQAENVGQVAASVEYPIWFSRQPSGFQREVLGPARFRAYQRGVPLSNMATTDRPLTVAELRRLYPSELAGIDG